MSKNSKVLERSTRQILELEMKPLLFYPGLIPCYPNSKIYQQPPQPHNPQFIKMYVHGRKDKPNNTRNVTDDIRLGI